jgi:transcriptional regulator with XRE-family HTH domain
MIKMVLLTKEEFYRRLGQVLKSEREKLGLSRAQAAKQLTQVLIDHERHLRKIAALSVMVEHIRRQKGLSRKQVAQRGNLPVEFVRDIEAGKIFNPEMYLVYCLSYGLRISLSQFEKRIDRLSRTELDEHDRPVIKKKKHTPFPQSNPPRLIEPGSTEKEKP